MATAKQLLDGMYKSGKRLPEIAKIYGIDRHTVGRVLKRNGFTTDRKTYHCNEHFFDVIDNGDKAYILGLLWSDGCNSVDLGKITLQLQEKDKQILEDISKAIQSDMPLWFLNLNDKNSNWYRKKGPHLTMTGASRGFSPAVAPVSDFSRGTTGSSESLSCGARDVRSPCVW